MNESPDTSPPADTAAALEARAYAAIGHEINLKSPAQLQQVLFEELGLPKTKPFGPRGMPNTGTEALSALRESSPHPFLDALLEYRAAAKRERAAGTGGQVAMKDMMTFAEIAEIMGVEAQSVRVYANRDPDFPPVAAYVGRAPLRSRKAVMRYLKIREVRTTGSGRVPRPVKSQD